MPQSKKLTLAEARGTGANVANVMRRETCAPGCTCKHGWRTAEVRCGGVLMVWLRRRALGWRGRKADATRPGSLHRVPSHSICNVHTYPRRS
jgi:hypothetical protein